eukprot:g20271.t1
MEEAAPNAKQVVDQDGGAQADPVEATGAAPLIFDYSSDEDSLRGKKSAGGCGDDMEVEPDDPLAADDREYSDTCGAAGALVPVTTYRVKIRMTQLSRNCTPGERSAALRTALNETKLKEIAKVQLQKMQGVGRGKFEHRIGKQKNTEVQRSEAAMSTPKWLLDRRCPVWAGFWCAQSLRNIGKKHPNPKNKEMEEPKKVKIFLGRPLENEDAKATIKKTLEQEFTDGAVEITFTGGMSKKKQTELFDVGQQEPSSEDEAEDAGTAAGDAQVSAASASGLHKKYEESKNDPQREYRQFFRESKILEKVPRRKMVRLKVFGQPKIPSVLLESLRSLPGLPPVNPEEEEVPARTYPKGELLPMSIKKRSGLETWVGSTLHTKFEKVNKGFRDCVTVDVAEQFYQEVLRKAVSLALQKEPRWGTTEIRTDYKQQCRLIAVATHDDVQAIAASLNPVSVIVYSSPDPAHCVQDVLQKVTQALGIPRHAPVFIPNAMNISQSERNPSTACSRTKATHEQLKELHDESFHGLRRGGRGFATATSDPEEVARLVEDALSSTASRATKFREQGRLKGAALRAVDVYHKTEAELRGRLAEEIQKYRKDWIPSQVPLANAALRKWWAEKKKEAAVHAGKLPEVPEYEKPHLGWEEDALRGKGKEKKEGTADAAQQVKKSADAKKKKRTPAGQKTGEGRAEAASASTDSQVATRAPAPDKDEGETDARVAEVANVNASAAQDGERRVNKYVTAVSVSDDAARRESLSRDMALVQHKDKTEYVSRSTKNKKSFPFLLLSLLGKDAAFSAKMVKKAMAAAKRRRQAVKN